MPVGACSSLTGLMPWSELRNHRGHSVASSRVSGRVSVRMPRAAARRVTWCSVMLGSAMLYLAVLRLLLDSHMLGILAVRSRRFDTAFTAAIGFGILWIAVSVDPLVS